MTRNAWKSLAYLLAYLTVAAGGFTLAYSLGMDVGGSLVLGLCAVPLVVMAAVGVGLMIYLDVVSWWEWVRS